MPPTAQLAEMAQTIVDHCPDGYAKAYAQRLQKQIFLGEHHRVIRTQVLYLRGNLSHWRGELARSIRRDLDQFLKDTDR